MDNGFKEVFPSHKDGAAILKQINAELGKRSPIENVRRSPHLLAVQFRQVIAILGTSWLILKIYAEESAHCFVCKDYRMLTG